MQPNGSGVDVGNGVVVGGDVGDAVGVRVAVGRIDVSEGVTANAVGCD